MHENLTVLRRLRDGRDPASGERLDVDHVCQRPEVIRALFAAVDAVDREVRAGRAESAPDDVPSPTRSRRPAAPKSGQPWSDDDDRQLVEAFDGGADERELCAALGRSRASIRARLIRHGRGALLGDGPGPRYPV